MQTTGYSRAAGGAPAIIASTMAASPSASLNSTVRRPFAEDDGDDLRDGGAEFPDADAPAARPPERPSKTRLKQASHDLQKLGVALVEL